MNVLRRSFVPLLMGGAALVALAGCSTGPASTPDEKTPAASASADAAARGLLPKDILDGGKLTVGIASTMGEPWSYHSDGSTRVEGLNVDLAQGVADALGLRLEVVDASFDELVPGLSSGRWDLTSAPMLDTPERQKTADFVGFLKGGSAFIVAAGKNTGALADLSLDKACGLTIASTKGSAESASLHTASDACTAAGKQPITVREFEGGTDGVLAVISKRVDAYDGAVAQMDYVVKGDHRVVRSGKPYNSGVSSLGLDKSSALVPAVQAGLQSLMDSGEYDHILSRYGVEELALDAATVNP